MVREFSNPYWSRPVEALLAETASQAGGLTSAQAQLRLVAKAGAPSLVLKGDHPLRLLLRQFESPLVLILLFGSVLSMALQTWADAAIVLAIVVASALFGFFQEYRATKALQALRGRLAMQSTVLRDGKPVTIAASKVVRGDVMRLLAGALVPADGVVLSTIDFLVTEATLTGESMPVEKKPGVVEADAPLARRSNSVFAGTSVRSGMADVLVMATGTDTQVGDIAALLEAAAPETSFERGVRQFGYLLLRIMLVLVVAVLAVSSALGRPVIESLLFAVALAVGMTPELLPAIVTVTLSKGASDMAKRGVIVRRLSSLENLGSMDILCTDKTGTLTEGVVALSAAIDTQGTPSPDVLQLAYLNAALESGIANPLDEAIDKAGEAAGLKTDGWRKVDEIPYDFVRRRLTIVVARSEDTRKRTIITKGSLKSVAEVCSSVRQGAGTVPFDAAASDAMEALLAAKGREGYRVLAVAVREAAQQADYTRADERDMTLVGLLLFSDPPKSDAQQTVADLGESGVAVKIITGDNREVAMHVAAAIGLSIETVLSGAEIATMKDEALAVMAERAGLFCEIDPQQKERIILALQKRGHVVGYMGDGINDAPALHAADVGISVDQAVDVARQSADMVLLQRDLAVLRTGIACGRRTFANTRKYIAITTSANFGNMVSMALATPFLPFLPLLAKQVLFNNFLSDIPSVTISSDNVDDDVTRTSEQLDVSELRRFMVVFGLVSSVFDLATFALLRLFLAAAEAEFQTAWFIVSLLTEVLIVLSLRTRASALRSRPSAVLLASTAAVALVTLVLPYVPWVAAAFGFVALPLPVMAGLVGIALAYVATTETLKRWYYARG